MSRDTGTIMVHRPQLTLLDKTATLSSWLIAGAAFMTVGWIAMQPDDPQGAVSILSRTGSAMMVVQAAALAAVTAGIATVIAGRRLADVGTFAAAVGLAVVSLRGATVTHLLLRGAEDSTTIERSLAVKFAFEAVGWFVVVIVALLASAAVMRWCFCGTAAEASASFQPLNTGSKPAQQRSELRSIASRAMSGFDLPRAGTGLFGAAEDLQTPPAEGFKHTLIAAAAGVAAMAFLSAGLSGRSIQHGQACFVVAAAMCIACYIANRAAPVRSPLWSIMAVAVLAVAGYSWAFAWACVRGPEEGLPACLPGSHFLRVLPLQYISVGTATAITMFWSSHVPRQAQDKSPDGDHLGIRVIYRSGGPVSHRLRTGPTRRSRKGGP